MTEKKQSALAHRTDEGEVDPRSYHLLGLVKFACPKIGDHERLKQVNVLIREVDKVTSAAGDPQARIHLTKAPGADAREQVEIRVQPLSLPESQVEAFLLTVRAAWPAIMAAGAERGWEAAKGA
jgi:hypothetical protein